MATTTNERRLFCRINYLIIKEMWDDRIGSLYINSDNSITKKLSMGRSRLSNIVLNGTELPTSNKAILLEKELGISRDILYGNNYFQVDDSFIRYLMKELDIPNKALRDRDIWDKFFEFYKHVRDDHDALDEKYRKYDAERKQNLKHINEEQPTIFARIGKIKYASKLVTKNKKDEIFNEYRFFRTTEGTVDILKDEKVGIYIKDSEKLRLILVELRKIVNNMRGRDQEENIEKLFIYFDKIDSSGKRNKCQDMIDGLNEIRLNYLKDQDINILNQYRSALDKQLRMIDAVLIFSDESYK